MRRTRRVVLPLLTAVVAAGFVFALLTVYGIRGVGHFDQPIVIEGDRPVRLVSYMHFDFNSGTQRQFESGPEYQLSGCQPATRAGANRFVARVMFTTQGFQKISHHHLGVVVEFEDGTRIGRVADIPPGYGTEPVVIRLP